MVDDALTSQIGGTAATTHPGRTTALVLMSTYSRLLQARSRDLPAANEFDLDYVRDCKGLELEGQWFEGLDSQYYLVWSVRVQNQAFLVCGQYPLSPLRD